MIDIDEIRELANHEPRIPVGYETTIALCDEVERLRKENTELRRDNQRQQRVILRNVARELHLAAE